MRSQRDLLFLAPSAAAAPTSQARMLPRGGGRDHGHLGTCRPDPAFALDGC